MSPLVQIVFNLTLNSIFSFLAGLFAITISLKIIRPGDGRWKLFLLSLPFVKIVYDLTHGIPKTSLLLTGLNILQLPPKSNSLNIGLGFGQSGLFFGPSFSVNFAAEDALKHRYATSIPDFLSAWLALRINPHLPSIILFALLGVSAALLVRRFAMGVTFERKRREVRATDKTLELVRIGFRKVDVYVSTYFTGSPFTGGILRPYICIPQAAYEALTPAELKATIEHEMAHARHFDLVWALFIKVLGDLFWFVPAYRWLARKIDRLREMLADEAAVRAGAPVAQLASALLKLEPALTNVPEPILYSSFIREKPLLKTRVERLLSMHADPKTVSKTGLVLRALFTLMTISVVMTTTFGGNHEISPAPEWLSKIPHWLSQFLGSW